MTERDTKRAARIRIESPGMTFIDTGGRLFRRRRKADAGRPRASATDE